MKCVSNWWCWNSFLHYFHFTFQVSDFRCPFGTTQPVLPVLNSPLCKWNIYFSCLCDSPSVCLCPTVHHRLRSQLLPVRHPEEMAALHEHQEHHPESLWWPIQGYFPGYLWEVRNISAVGTLLFRDISMLNNKHLPCFCGQELQARVWQVEDLVWAQAYRWHGSSGPEVIGRLCLGLQELRWRCSVWHPRSGYLYISFYHPMKFL